MRVLLAGHGGAYNRGEEAIMRSTRLLLAERWPEVELTLASLQPESDRAVDWGFPLEIISGLDRSVLPGRGTPWYERRRHTLLRPGASWQVPLAPMLEAAAHSDVIFSVGGDNYTADYGYPTYFLKILDMARGLRKPVVIWGASIGPFPETEQWAPVWERLRRADLITVRESLTQEYLAAHGLTERVALVADPAFLLPMREVDLTPFWPRGEVVGLCVSPLMLRLAAASGRHLDVAVVSFVRGLVEQGYGVLLIPHVMGGLCADEEDHDCLLALETLIERPEAVRVAPAGRSAVEYKYMISRCSYMITARTHAAIAAYSTGVPTLALSYSQKARGMCRDLFGHTDYLVEGRQATAEDLREAFARLTADREKIVAQLTGMRSTLAERARAGGEQVARMLEARRS